MIPLAATALRDHLAACVEGFAARVLIGHPALIEQQLAALGGANGLNLFFYRIEHAGYPPQASREETTYLRLFCMVTPLGSKDAVPSTGEVDLRLLAAVIDALHHAPILDVKDQGVPVAQLQVVPAALSLDDINKIWATQHEVSYRPSVAYELALLPVSRRQPPEPAQQVRTAVVGVTADMTFQAPPLAALQSTTVDPANAAWAPYLAFVAGDDDAGPPSLTASAILKNSAVAARLLVVGKVDEAVTLRFARWGEKLGWALGSLSEPITVHASSLDPKRTYTPTKVNLPLASGNQQVLLWVERYQDGKVYASNTLLLPVHQA